MIPTIRKSLQRLPAVILLAVCVTSLYGQPAAAITGIQNSYYDDDIGWLDENDDPGGAVGCGTAPVTGTSSPGGFSGTGGTSGKEENAKAIYDFLTTPDLLSGVDGSDSMSGVAAAGFIGNWVQESGLDPTTPGGYLVQWGGGRLTGLQAFAAQQGKPVTDLTVQLQYVVKEITTLPDYKPTLDAVRNGTDAAQIAQVISDNYEHPAADKANNPNRQSQATAYATSLGSKPGSGFFAPGAGGTVSSPAAGGTPTGTTTAGTPANGASCQSTPAATSGAPGQTVKAGKGFTLADNADYSTTPCAPGSTQSTKNPIYTHPTQHFKIMVCIIDGTTIDVASIVSDKVVAMVKAAQAAGIVLDGGGFRSYEEQQSLRILHGCASPSLPSSACSPPTAPPGSSMHERGLAIDFAAGGSIKKGSPQYNWLTQNAATYGFYNWPVEDWHWSTTGT